MLVLMPSTNGLPINISGSLKSVHFLKRKFTNSTKCMHTRFFCLFALFLVGKTAIAQSGGGQLVFPAYEVKMRTNGQNLQNKFTLSPGCGRALNIPPPRVEYYFLPQFINLPSAHSSFFFKPVPVLPSNHYNRTIGWMCLQEWKLEKTLAMPVKLRLGNKAEVDYLEGKSRSRF